MCVGTYIFFFEKIVALFVTKCVNRRHVVIWILLTIFFNAFRHIKPQLLNKNVEKRSKKLQYNSGPRRSDKNIVIQSQRMSQIRQICIIVILTTHESQRKSTVTNLR